MGAGRNAYLYSCVLSNVIILSLNLTLGKPEAYCLSKNLKLSFLILESQTVIDLLFKVAHHNSKYHNSHFHLHPISTQWLLHNSTIIAKGKITICDASI